jgi:hypothetical protein
VEATRRPVGEPPRDNARARGAGRTTPGPPSSHCRAWPDAPAALHPPHYRAGPLADEVLAATRRERGDQALAMAPAFR